MRRSYFVVPACLVLFAFCIYLLTLAPDMLNGDSGEFQFAAPLLSIVHPTGYPLYLLIAKLFTLIPIGSIAYRVNLFSAVCAALTVGMFYWVVLLIVDERRTTNDEQPSVFASSAVIRHSSAFAAALTLAFSPTFWSQASEAEVYALNSLFVIALIGLSVWVKRSPSPASGFIPALHPVLRASHAGKRSLQHRTWSACPRRTLRVPAFGGSGMRTFAVRGRGWEGGWLWLAFVLGLSLTHHRSIILVLPALIIYLYPFAGLRKVWPLALLLLLVPLILYLYTPLRYDATPYAQIKLDDQHMITTLTNSPSAFVAHVLGTGFSGALRWDALTWERLLTTPERITANFTLLGRILISIGMLWLLWRREWRLAAFFIMLSVSYFVFNAAYHIGDIDDFYTPVYILGALLMAYGIAALGHWRRALLLIAFIAPVWLLITQFVPMRQHADARAGWQKLLAQNPPAGSILISNDRDELTPLYYLQLVEGVRTDLFPLFPLISAEPPFRHVVSLTEYALQTSRPVYFIKPLDSLSVKFHMQSEGQLVRVLGLQATRPDHAIIRDSPLLKFIGWSQTQHATRNTDLQIVLFWQAQGATRPDITTYVHLIGRDGQKIAQDDHTPGDVYYPPSQWAADEILYDSHIITLPPNLPRDEYRLVAGAYLPNGGALEGIARIELGTIQLDP